MNGSSGYGKVSEKNGRFIRNLGYLVSDLIGMGAGTAVGAFLYAGGTNGWVTVLASLAAAAAVAGVISLLICRLSGAWDDEIAAYFVPTVANAQIVHRTAQEGVPTTYGGHLKTNRGLVKYILLNFITLGIYSIYGLWSVGNDINVIARKYDGKKTMNYCLIFFLFSSLTFGIASIVWFHKVSGRIGRELERRGIGYRFGAGSFWGWNLLGSIIGIGPFVYMHKLFKAMNLLSKDYNVNF